eukprot:10792650-Alexandrium_andersonii.AAC.1
METDDKPGDGGEEVTAMHSFSNGSIPLFVRNALNDIQVRMDELEEMIEDESGGPGAYAMYEKIVGDMAAIDATMVENGFAPFSCFDSAAYLLDATGD